MAHDITPSIRHLTLRVAGRPKVEIVGFPAGDLLMPLPRAVCAHIRGNFGNYGGLVLTEGYEGGRSFVPRRLAKGQVNILPNWVKEIEDSRLGEIEAEPITVGLRYLGEILRNAALSPLAYFQRLAVERTPPAKGAARQARRRVEAQIRPYGLLKPEAGFIVNVRSLVMAGELLRRSREARTPAVLLCNALHAGPVHRLIENPGLAMRYIDAYGRSFPGHSVHLAGLRREFEIIGRSGARPNFRERLNPC